MAALALLGLPLSSVLPAAAADVPVVDVVWENAGPAAGGGRVSISGHGFTGATGVRFGVATAAASFEVLDDTTITAVAPPPAIPPQPITLVNVFVDGPNGSSVESMSSWYRYVAPPRITAATPITSSFEGGQTVELTIAGIQDFDWLRNAYLDGERVWNYVPIDIGETTTVRLFTPPHVAGVAHLAFETVGGRSDPIELVYLDAPLPRVTASNPRFGPIAGGTTVHLDGSGFTGTSEVLFDTAPAPSFTVVSDTRLDVVTPAVPAATSAPILVRTPAGPSVTTAPAFVFQGPPIVRSTTPSNGPPTGGTAVDVYGAGFDAATVVRFGDAPAASVVHVGDGWLRTTTPAHAAGVVPVVVESARGPSTDPVTFEFTDDGPPTTDRVTPSHGPQAGGYEVVIDGSGFTTTTAVTFGGWYQLPAPAFRVLSDAQLAVTVPASSIATVFEVRVTNARGTSRTAFGGAWFTYDQAPSVAWLSQPGGSTAGGNTIHVYGAAFDGVTAVRFGDQPATSFGPAGDGVLEVVVPPHAAGSVAVSVTAASGTSTTEANSANTYDYVPPGVPVVTAMDVRDALDGGGGVVHITATDADRTTGVRFGTVAAPAFRILGPDLVEATIPAHAPGMVDVVLDSSAGPSAPNPTTSFTFVQTPPPYFWELFPAFGPLAGGTAVRLSGGGFVDVTSVTFGGVPATSFTVDSPYQITAIAPPSAATDDEQVQVAVTTPLGTTVPYWQTVFTYQAVHPLELTHLTPARGGVTGGERVTIYGRGFTHASAVLFGDGIPAESFTVIGDFEIDLVAPAVPEPYLYNVTVVTPTGATPPSASSWFLYLSAPEVWGLSSYRGLTGGGEQVTITGDQLLGVQLVLFGDAWADFEIVDNHTIIATAPPCAVGVAAVHVLGDHGSSDVRFTNLYTYRTPGTPEITSVAANQGSLAGGETVVITGSGFSAATSVRFDQATVATSFHVDSDTQITAVAPPRPGPALVNVYVDDAVGSSPPGPASWYRYR